MAYFISRIFYKVLLKVFFRFEVIGRENLPKKGPFIVASNHVSYADPAVLGVACNTVPLTFMAKRELFSMPILGPWVRAVGCIPIERTSAVSKSLKKALQKLQQQKAIAIFPEGTRSSDGRLQKPEPGIGFLALKSKAPIIPVYVSGTDKALPRGKKSVRLHKVRAKIGNAIDISESAKSSEKRKIYESIGEKVMNTIGQLKYK